MVCSRLPEVVWKMLDSDPLIGMKMGGEKIYIRNKLIHYFQNCNYKNFIPCPTDECKKSIRNNVVKGLFEIHRDNWFISGYALSIKLLNYPLAPPT